MKKYQNQQHDARQQLPKEIAEMPERQRETMQEARKKGEFDGKEHLAKSPIGRAVAHGFPLKPR